MNPQKCSQRQKIPESRNTLHPENPVKSYNSLIRDLVCPYFPLLFCPSLEDQKAGEERRGRWKEGKRERGKERRGREKGKGSGKREREAK